MLGIALQTLALVVVRHHQESMFRMMLCDFSDYVNIVIDKAIVTTHLFKYLSLCRSIAPH